MTKSTPWDDINKPEADYNTRLISESETIPLFWSKDIEGRCLFIIELEGNHLDQFRKSIVTVNGIDVDLRKMEAAASQWLVFTLEKQVDRDLFMGLCETLISSLQSVTESTIALDVTLAHIKRWKVFFAGRNSHLLSPEEVRGLFCELVFLRELYQRHFDEKTSITAWCGPENSHQDFIFWNTAVEIKSLSGRNRSTVRISSEDQLESICDHLYLVIYRLSDLPDGDRSMSLNELVQVMARELTDAVMIEEFYKLLATSGYIEMREYDKPEFQTTSQQTYQVSDEFPRLIRSELLEGILSVKYEIKLENIIQYKCDSIEIWGND